MDGKQVGTIGIAVVLGAVAGALAGSMAGSGQVEAESTLPKEIARLEAALTESQRDLARAQREIGHLKDRMSDAETGLADVREELPTAGELAAAGRAGVADARAAEEGGAHAALDGAPVTRLGLPGGGEAIVLGDGGLTAELSGEMKQRLDRMRKALALRTLTEDERWDKAQTVLGLSYNQVEELKSAVAARKEALAEARTRTEVVTEDGATMIRSKVDGAKMEAAQKAYDDRVSSVLNAEQREGWKNDGYEQAVGGARASTAFAFTSGVHIGGSVEVEESAEK